MPIKLMICVALIVAGASLAQGQFFPPGSSGGGGSSAFSAITAGTNAAALVMGTGGSLTVSGSGTVGATSLGGTAAASYALLASPAFTGTATIGATISLDGTTGAITTGSGSGVGGNVAIQQGTLPALVTNAVNFLAPTSVTAYGLMLPGAAPSANQALLWGAPSSGVSTATFAAIPLLDAANVLSVNGAAGVPALKLSGSWNASATGCQVLLQPSGATTFSVGLAGGTALCINAPSGFAGAFVKMVVNNGGNAFSVAANGSIDAYQITTVAGIIAGAGQAHQWVGRSLMWSPADGVIEFTNNANSDFNRLQFGGTTSSFPALKRSTTKLQVRLADDSAAGTIESKFNSSDGTAGVTGATCTAWKDGLCVAP